VLPSASGSADAAISTVGTHRPAIIAGETAGLPSTSPD
jgi:hypothetical protein